MSAVSTDNAIVSSSENHIRFTEPQIKNEIERIQDFLRFGYSIMQKQFVEGQSFCPWRRRRRHRRRQTDDDVISQIHEMKEQRTRWIGPHYTTHSHRCLSFISIQFLFFVFFFRSYGRWHHLHYDTSSSYITHRHTHTVVVLRLNSNALTKRLFYINSDRFSHVIWMLTVFIFLHAIWKTQRKECGAISLWTLMAKEERPNERTMPIQ